MFLKKYSRKIILGVFYTFIVFLYLITLYGQIKCSYIGYSNPDMLPRLKGEPINTSWNFLFYLLSAICFFIVICKLVINFVSPEKWYFKQVLAYYLIYLIYLSVFTLYFFYFSYTDFYVAHISN